MYSANLDSDEQAVHLPTKAGRSNAKRAVFAVQFTAFLLGLGLLVFLVFWLGLQPILESLRQVGWGIIFVIALSFARQFIRAACIYLAIPPDHRSIAYRGVLAARLGGEAVNFLSFTGPLLGDATKMALLKKQVKIAHSAAAVVIDDILYYLSVLLVILSGIALLLYVYGSGDAAMQYALVGVTGFTIFIFAGLALTVFFDIKPVSFAFRRLHDRNLLPGFLSKARQYIYDIEDNVFGFYHHRRSIFFVLIGLDFLAHVVSVFEVYVALGLLGLSATVATTYIIESLTKVINLAFSFVPGAIGVYEGGSGVILDLLGYTAAVGVALALVRRGGILFTTMLGLAVLLWRMITRSSRSFTDRMVNQDS